MRFNCCCKVSVELSCEFLLLKFRQYEHSEQSKVYFERSTFTKLRCFLKLDYFDFVCLHFHWVFLICLPTFSEKLSWSFSDNFRSQMKRSRSTIAQVIVACFDKPTGTFAFPYHTLWELCSRLPVKHLLTPKLSSLCAYVELWMHLGSLESTQETHGSLVSSRFPVCIHNSIYSRQAWTSCFFFDYQTWGHKTISLQAYFFMF